MINIRTIVVSVIAVFACGAGTSLTGAEIPATQPGQSTDAFRYAGHVLDETGQPIAGAEVIATHRDLDGHAYDFNDFKQVLCAQAAKKETVIRVVYSLSRPDFAGSNTQFLVLNQADAASLIDAAQQ